jgi:hypothetical protein
MKSINLEEQGLLPANQILLTKSNTNDESCQLDSNSSKSDIILHNKSKIHYLPIFNNYQSTFINDVVIYDEVIGKESIDITRDTECFDYNITTDIYAQFPLFFINRNIIKIPTKVEYVLRRFISKKLLKEIHLDIDVAIELCLLFTN